MIKNYILAVLGAIMFGICRFTTDMPLLMYWLSAAVIMFGAVPMFAKLSGILRG